VGSLPRMAISLLHTHKYDIRIITMENNNMDKNDMDGNYIKRKLHIKNTK